MATQDAKGNKIAFLTVGSRTTAYSPALQPQGRRQSTKPAKGGKATKASPTSRATGPAKRSAMADVARIPASECARNDEESLGPTGGKELVDQEWQQDMKADSGSNAPAKRVRVTRAAGLSVNKTPFKSSRKP
jgi:hypothetical protein